MLSCKRYLLRQQLLTLNPTGTWYPQTEDNQFPLFHDLQVAHVAAREPNVSVW